jgi:hypothetical protein
VTGIVFRLKDVLKKDLRLTEERHAHILERPEIRNQEDRIKATLRAPDIVKVSNHVEDVLLYYKLYERTPVTRKYLVVIVRVLDGDGFIITAFYTDKIKKGVTKWVK